MTESNDKRKSIIKDICFYAAICGTSLLLFTKVLMISSISGDSMNDTYRNGDTVLAGRLSYADVGDVVICEVAENTDYIKRIIAKGGDIVEIDYDSGEVKVNGNVIDEPYIREPTHLDEGIGFPLEVPENCYFVMGDNRNFSRDSRSTEIGCIHEDRIKGKVLFRLPF